MKNILRQIACGIKAVYAILDFFPIKTRLLLLNASVLSHLYYPAILLSGISENLLTRLEKQLNWGVKECFNRSKHDHSSDLKINYNILPVRYFLDIEAINYYWKFKNLMIPAFKGKTVLPIAKIRRQNRKNEEYFDLRTNSEFLQKYFFKRVTSLWNTLPENIKNQKKTQL